MPDMRSYYATMLKDYEFSGYLSTPTEVSVWAGTVTADASDPAFYLTVSTTSGSYAGALPDMEIIITSSANVFKGRLHVAPDATGNVISATKLPVNEFGRTRIKVVNGDKFSVVESYRLRDYLVGASVTFPKQSRIEYAGQSNAPEPLANVGGLFVGWKDAGQTYGTTGFYGSRSQIMDGDNVDGLGHSHEINDGTIVGGTGTDADIVVRFPVGERWVTYYCFDLTSSVQAVKRTWVRVHDPDTDPPIGVANVSITLVRQGGGRATFRVLDASAAAIDYLPEGALIVYWEDEWRNGVLGSYGSDVPYRSHIKFVGFLISESISISPLDGSITFEAVSPLEIMNQLPGFGDIVDNTSGAAASWQQYKNLTLQRMLQARLRWHSSYLTTFDLQMPFTDIQYPGFRVPEASLLQQMQKLLGQSYYIGCTQTGTMVISKKPQRMSSSERAALDTALEMNASALAVSADSSNAEFLNASWDHRLQYRDLTLKAVTSGYSGTTPITVVAPSAPADGADRGTEENAIVADIAEARQMAGDAYADLCALYGSRKVVKGLKLALWSGLHVIDPAYPDWYEFVFVPPDDSVMARRSFDTRLIAQEIRINADSETGIKTVEGVFDEETTGEPGTYVPSVTSDESTLPPTTPITLPDPSASIIIGGLGRGAGAIFALNEDGGLYSFTSFTSPAVSGGPAVTRTELSPTGTIQDMVQNAFDTSRIIYVTDAAGAIYTLDDPGSANTITLRKTLRGTAVRREIEASFGADHVVVRSWYTDGTYVVFSTDGGVTWGSETLVSSTYDAGIGVYSGLHVSSLIPGTGLFSALWTSSDCGEITQSFDAEAGAATWSASGATYPFSSQGSQSGGGSIGSGGRTAASCHQATSIYGGAAFLSCPIAILDSPCTVTDVDFWLNFAGNSGSVPGGAQIHVQVRFYDSGGSLISAHTIFNGYLTYGGGAFPYNEYRQCTWTGAVTGVKYIAIEGYTGNTGAPGVLIDDITINAGSGGAVDGSAIYRLTSTYGTITRATSPSGYSPVDTLSGAIHVPFHNNPTESIVYFSGESGGSNFIKRKNADGTVTDITPTISGERQRLAYNRALHTCPMDRLTVLAATEGATTSGVFMSRDGGGSWTQISTGTTTDYTGAECAGNDRNYGYVWGKNGAIGYVDLDQQLIDDRRGNTPTDYPSADRILRIFSI